jgi:hypothetical protein
MFPQPPQSQWAEIVTELAGDVARAVFKASKETHARRKHLLTHAHRTSPP